MSLIEGSDIKDIEPYCQVSPHNLRFDMGLKLKIHSFLPLFKTRVFVIVMYTSVYQLPAASKSLVRNIY